MQSFKVNPTIVGRNTFPDSYLVTNIRRNYFSPSYPGTGNLLPLSEVFSEWFKNKVLNNSGSASFILLNLEYAYEIKNNGITISKETIYQEEDPTIEGIKKAITESPASNITLDEGYAEIIYYVKMVDIYEQYTADLKITYHLTITNEAPIYMEKWNAYTVLERVLNVVEPLKKDEEPRFKIDQSQKAWLESIETPEFQFTQSTLREILQGVGSYIHAEPRLIKNNEEYIITFDKYGGNSYSEFTNKYSTYASQQQSINIENFATNLDSSVDNFINSFENSVNGSISEPFYGGFKSVLAEGSYVRITDESMYIYTQYPIHSVKRLICAVKDKETGDIKTGDIAPYVFESAEYNKLSSYDDIYPTSKSYALYYTIGQNGIYGLNFKREQIHSEWSNYSLIKIIKAALNVDVEVADLKNIGFNVEYVPIYPARVQQNRSIISAGKKWTKPYNQGQNLIETQYYGQNLKGVIARLGNIDKTLTYVIMGYPAIEPKIGDLFNDDYYIADVSYEVQPYYTKMTLALSKDFNRYSEYVGVNSVKRMYEISERQAFESEISYREFVVFSDNGNNINVSAGADRIMFGGLGGFNEIYSIRDIFLQEKEPIRISAVMAQGFGYNDEILGNAILSVITSTLGNAIIVSFKYEDNYSAGTYAENITDMGDNINAVYTQTLPYTDEYGRVKYLSLKYICGVETVDIDNKFLYPPNNNPGWADYDNGVAIETKWYPILIEKGNTEIISFNYQLEFVSTNKDIIIGSELPKLLYFTREKNLNIKLILYADRLNKFNNTFDNSKVHITEKNGDLLVADSFEKYTPKNLSRTYKSWAFVIDNNENYKLILGKNMEITNNTELFNGLKFSVVSEKDLYK